MMTNQLIHRSKRFEISAPVTFWWSSPEGAVQSGSGTTRNISSSGVLVAAEDCPALGVPIQVTIQMPGNADGDHEMKLSGEGVVIRVEGQGDSTPGDGLGRFAAAVQFYLEPAVMS
jgi:hypothetical protein